MAKVMIEVEVCDVCKDPKREIGSYTLASGHRKATKALCVEHAAPLEELLPREEERAEVPKPRAPRRTAKKAAGASTKRRTRAEIEAELAAEVAAIKGA